uniref:Uncharacterized protein n=1 Tax=Anguilla anguilla TaxID=7936 RepID=A0A0E9ST38_ANGAN
MEYSPCCLKYEKQILVFYKGCNMSMTVVYTNETLLL